MIFDQQSSYPQSKDWGFKRKEKIYMNKLLTKIVGVSLGLALAAGTGFAVANSGKKSKLVNAESSTAFSFSRSGSSDSVTTGYEMVLTNYKANADNYQDKSSTVGLDIGVKKSSGVIWSTTPESISLTVKVGGGSAKDPLANNVTANLIDSTGAAILGTEVTITSKVETTTGKDYTVSVPTANNAAGIMIHHEKESSYNVRIYAISMSYEPASGSVTTYAISTSVTHGTYSGDTTISEGGTATVTITADEHYVAPSDITVRAVETDIVLDKGVEYDYERNSLGNIGVVTLRDQGEALSISASCSSASIYTITTNLTNLTSDAPANMYEYEVVNVTLSVASGKTETHALPTSITVTNASYEYNSSTGAITLNGAAGNIVITASAIDKPQEAEESFSTASAWTTVTANEEYTTTNNLITATWTKGTSGSNAGAYWNPGRFYKNHVLTISATTGAGAVTTIKSIEFTCSSGSSGSPAVYYNDALYSSTVSVTKPTVSPGTVSVTKDSLVITHTMSGTVTEVVITMANQTRIPSFKVTYEKDQSNVPLQSISATCSGVLVSQQVTPVVTFNPSSASNKVLTYEVTSGSQYATVDASTGVITGIGAGTATITITPDDSNASPITVDVVVSALPSIYGVEVGKKYSVTASLQSTNFELTGISTSGSYPYGTSTNYDTDPSESFPVKVVNGLYAHTVALEVEIDSTTKYLSFDKTNSNNNLTAVTSIDRSACWIFASEDSSLVVRNVDVYARKLGATTTTNNDVVTGRFACYQNLSSTVITPTFTEIVEVKTDKEYVQDFVDLYLHMSDYTENNGWCNDGEHSYYLTAKAGYNSLIYGNATRVSLFQNDSDFSAAKARYEAWAGFNNDANPYDGNDTVVSTIHSNLSLRTIAKDTNGMIAIIVIISMVTVTAIGGYFLLRKKKEER